MHTAAYVRTVRDISADPSVADGSCGLGTEDDPAFAGMHEASARIVGGSLTAAQAVCRS